MSAAWKDQTPGHQAHRWCTQRPVPPLMPADPKDTSFPFLFTFCDFGTRLYPYSIIHNGMVVKLQKATIQAKSFDNNLFFPEMQERWKSSRGPWTDAAAVSVWPHQTLSLQSQYQADSRGDKSSNTTHLNLVINKARWRRIYHHLTWV